VEEGRIKVPGGAIWNEKIEKDGNPELVGDGERPEFLM